MNTRRLLPAALATVAALLSLAPLARAADTNQRTSFEAGPAGAWYDFSGGDADLAGIGGSARLHLGQLLVFDTSLVGSYSYLTSTDSADYERHDTDLDLVLSASFLGFLVPYATVGVSYDYFDATAYSGTDDWDPGYALGAGVGVTLIPALLDLTPSVRFVDGPDLDTVTYSLDARLHFSILVVGARAAYEDNLSRDGEATSATGYVALRF
jgi:hypothetical protein